MDLDSVKSGNRDSKPRVGDLLQVYTPPKNKWFKLRLLGGVEPRAGYWVKTKKKDGKSTKFWTPCPSFDPATQERDTTIYDPWRDQENKEYQAVKDGNMDKEERTIQYATEYWMNAIVRAEQKKAPSTLPKHTASERKTKIKEKDSDSWTPVFAIKLGKSFIGKVQGLKGLNTYESSKTGAVKSYSVADAKFGRDINVLYDDSKAPADQYQIQLGDKRTPLTEDELEYLTWDLSVIHNEINEAELKADFSSWANRMGIKTKKAKAEDDEEDDAPKSKNKKKPVAEDDEDDMDDDFDDEDDEPKSKAKSKTKSKPVDEDEEEEDDDFDSEDEDEDEDEDDEDDSDSEEDFDDEEDEEDEPPAKKTKGKAPAKKSKKPVDEDEDDEDDFDSEDEDEDEPPAKKKPVVKNSKKKPVDEDEDEDDFDDEEDDFEDEEEEDEPPKKSKKVVAKKATPAKKKKASDEDDFDDFDDE